MKDYKEGELYILDANRCTQSEVILLVNYGKFFGKVQSPLGGESWDVMLNRLTLKNYSKNETKS